MNGKRLNEAINFLFNIVAEEEILFKDIHKLASESDISLPTLKRAKIIANVKSKRSGKEWAWYMDANSWSYSEMQSDLLDTRIIPDNPAEIVEPENIHLPQKAKQLDWSKLTRIHLICGASNFQGKFDSFAGRIPRILENDLMDGDAFAFCNCTKTQVCVLQWQGDGFAQYFKRSDYGQFPWPPKRDVQAVEITLKDLKTLIEYPRFVMRLLGMPTPRSLVL